MMRALSGRWRAGALVALCGLAATTAAAWWRAAATPAGAPLEVRIAAAGGGTAMTGAGETSVSISLDGRVMVYTTERHETASPARDALIVRQLETGVEQTLFTAASGAEARSPFFSDDGRSVGFVDRGRLMTVPAQGGSAVELCACGASAGGSALWLRNGTIVYHASGRLRVLEPNGRRRDLTRLNTIAGERDHLGPAVLPDEDTVLYTVVHRDATTEVKAVSLGTGTERVLVSGGMFAQYAGGGHLLYVDTASRLHVADLDLGTLRLSGDAPLADRRVHANSRGGASFAVSRTGTLVYAPAVDATSTGLVLSWVTRGGQQQASGLPVGPYTVPRISPTGDTVAIEVWNETTSIWVWNLATNALAPQAAGAGTAFPTWMPDGRSLLMLTAPEQRGLIQRLWLDGSGRVTPIAAPVALTGIYAVAPDGRLGVFRSERPGQHLRAMSPEGGAVSPLTQGQGLETAADLSPDGAWMVYDASPVGGRSAAQASEVFVQPFPGESSPRQQISIGGGSRPLWSRDGTEIIYVNYKNQLMRVAVTGGADPGFGGPTPVFADPAVSADWYFGLGRRSFDLTRDGSRFLVLTPSIASVSRRPSSLVVASNWLRHAHRPWTRLMNVVRRRAA